MRLMDLCPRLARARDQWVAYENARHEAMQIERENIFRLEGLVAHRELQEMRAVAACGRAKSVGARRSAGVYLMKRQAMLVQAQAALARSRVRLDRLERGQ